jgi:glucose/arabinose dehydrogenase
VILRVAQPFPNHNGGDLVFGPDGKLYVGMGDGGGGGDPFGNGQRLDTLLGKILRLDVDRRGSIVPADNPFVGRAGARPEIFAYGLRNPWRFSFDRATGALWIGDVGQDRWEEIDRLSPRQARGANLGWSTFEGRHPLLGGSARNGPTVFPVAEYDRGQGISVTGGFVYRGTRVPALRGRYVYGDYGSGRVWALGAGPRRGAPREITGDLGVRLSTLTSFGVGADGELYVIGNGTLYRFARG